MGKKRLKVALILNDDFSMWHFRGGLIKSLVSRGISVYIIVPPGRYVTKLEEIGAKVIPVIMKRFFSPLRDVQLMLALYKIFRTEKFDLIHTMTIKPNIFGVLAAKIAGVKSVVCLVSGLGFVFSDKSTIAARIVRLIIVFLYRFALSMSDKVWFQNKDDMGFFVKNKMIKKEKGLVIRSGGIDIKEFSKDSINYASLDKLRKELCLSKNTKCVLMVAARMIWSKGVREFIETANILRSKYSDWVFLMVCPMDLGSPDSVPTEYLNTHTSENLIIIDYFRPDIKNIIALADIMVLPSFYREGVPRTLLEGLSLSKSIITTNNVGCKEVVEDGKNGFLIPVKDSPALVEKLKILMDDDLKRNSFGEYSRRMAEKYFDEKIVISKILTELYEI